MYTIYTQSNWLRTYTIHDLLPQMTYSQKLKLAVTRWRNSASSLQSRSTACTVINVCKIQGQMQGQMQNAGKVERVSGTWIDHHKRTKQQSNFKCYLLLDYLFLYLWLPKIWVVCHQWYQALNCLTHIRK